MDQTTIDKVYSFVRSIDSIYTVLRPIVMSVMTEIMWSQVAAESVVKVVIVWYVILNI